MPPLLYLKSSFVKIQREYDCVKMLFFVQVVPINDFCFDFQERTQKNTQHLTHTPQTAESSKWKSTNIYFKNSLTDHISSSSHCVSSVSVCYHWHLNFLQVSINAASCVFLTRNKEFDICLTLLICVCIEGTHSKHACKVSQAFCIQIP